MSVKIITDSTSDIRYDEVEKLGIKVVPLNVSFGDETYKDSVDITVEDFYKKLKTSQYFPKTSQPAPELFVKIFNEAKEKGDDVIYIAISSGLSGTIGSANLAKSIVDYDKIHIIDSLSSIQGLRLLVHHACKMRDLGYSAHDIISQIEDMKKRIKIFSMIDTLEYLYKGGRLSKAKCIFGNAVGLKPLIDLDEKGKIRMYGKVIGINRAYKAILDSFSKHPFDPEYPIYFGYTDTPINLNVLINKIESKYDLPGKDISQIGPTIGSHIGHGGFCVIYVEKK